MGKVTYQTAVEFTRLYEQGFDTHYIGEKFDVTHKTVCNHLRKFGVKLRPSGQQPRAIAHDIRLDKDMAYILGVIGPGDGFIHKYSVALEAIDKEFVEEFKDLLEKITGLKCAPMKLIEPKNLNRKLRYKTMLNSKKFVEFLAHFKVPFGEKNWGVPEAIKQAVPEVQAAYLRAFADSQAWVQDRCVGFCVKNTTGLKEIQGLIENLGISVRFHFYRKSSRLYISGRRNIETFAVKVGFVIKRKQEKLTKILASYKLYRTPTEEINKLIPNMIQLRRQGLSYAKIARGLGVSKPAVQKRLRSLLLPLIMPDELR